MAVINFYLRGEKIYFRYRPNRKFDLLIATPYSIKPENWDSRSQSWNKAQIIKGAQKTETKLLNKQIERFNSLLSSFRSDVEIFIQNNSDKEASNLKELVKDFVTKNYFAHRINTKTKVKKYTIPENMFDLINHYIDYRSVADVTKGVKPLAENTIKKYKTLQNILHTFNKKLLVTEINDVFRIKFVEFLNKKLYSANTQVKFIKDIKMFCKFANKEHNVSKQVLAWKIDSEPENVAEFVTFTFDDLRKLKFAEMPTEAMDNVRDWLLISCFTSVRVSELFTFDSANIEDEVYLKVYEKKNRNTKSGGLKYIYLMPDVIEILNKRNGQFPKKISDQRYNEYVKKVCELAKIDHLTIGGKVEVHNGMKRKVKKEAPFYEFVTSHSGRATYVTLFSQYLPTEIIQMQTNHHSTEMVEQYNKISEEELALQRAKTVAQAHKEASKKYNILLNAN